MGQLIYYHNLTQGWFNENSYSDAAENSNPRDIIKFTIRGSALVFDLLEEDHMIEDHGEYEYARELFLDHFEEFTGYKFTEWETN